MAVFAGADLKKWLDAKGMSVSVLAVHISCDETTIYRYISGKIKPNPDVMYEICEALGDLNRWCDWMRTEYPTSYARVHPESPRHNLQGALMSLIAESKDVGALELDLMRDCADGSLDDPVLRKKALKEATELLGAAQRFVNALQVEGVPL